MDTDTLTAALVKQLNTIIGATGQVVDARMTDPMVDGSWTAVFDTEYAALKAWQAYHNTPGVYFAKHVNGFLVGVTR